MKSIYLLIILVGVSYSQNDNDGYTRILSISSGEYSKHGWDTKVSVKNIFIKEI